MRIYEKLILTILITSFGFADGITFRGKSVEAMAQETIPLAFQHFVESELDLPHLTNLNRGSYLIIVPDGLVSYLDQFVSFKKSQGFDVNVSLLSEAGSSSDEIKTFIGATLAEDPMLEYVLLIGDVDGFAALPSFYYGPENDVSDQKYSHLLGDDIVPDVFIGRMSVDNLTDLIVILSKTMKYARDPLAYDQNWLNRGLIVAGNYSNTYPIPITPKWTSYWLRDELLDFGYSNVDTVFYPPTQQGAPQIISAINQGAGIVNYRGWGDANGWHYPEFHVSDVNDLNNGWLTPVFMSYVCNSNDFANNVDPCLSEAVLRSGTPSVPKGGVAFIGPSDLHTSTKYNNIINAYMYDAMLNHKVVELAPAMLAGQLGLQKEFPEQDDAGEAQEFYTHVYNILGDPSLQVYTGTPNTFLFDYEPIYDNDGFLDLRVTDINGQTTRNAVIAVMMNDELIAKGLTDSDGRFLASLESQAISNYQIYANKNGYIQGMVEVQSNEPTSDLYLSNITISSVDNGEMVGLGESFSLSIILTNSSGNTVNGFNGTVIFSEGVESQSVNVTIPTLESGESSTMDLVDIVIYNPFHSVGATFRLINESGDRIVDGVIPVELPIFNITFENTSITPNSTIEPILSVESFSKVSYNDVHFDIGQSVDGAEVEYNSESNNLSDLSPFSSSLESTNYTINIDDVSYGSDITFFIDFVKSNHSIYRQEVQLHIEPQTENLPVAPSHYGYWAFDDTDTGFDQTPTFDWVELDPTYGGSGATEYLLDDDDHVDVDLPFTFQYHGQEYDRLTISSNGWASFESCYIDYFWNYTIPMYMGPKALLAPFWDDLEVVDENWIRVYTRYDEVNGQFIVEWSRVLNGYDEVTEETFEIILYTQEAMSTESGDGVIDFQYLEIDDVDATKNYATVGIESPEKNDGIQYSFNHGLASGAAPLANERIIRFTTYAPDNYVAPLDVDNDIYPSEFILSNAYPNPFNPTTHLNLMIGEDKFMSVLVYDMLGREVNTLMSKWINAGHHQIIWNGQNYLGQMVSSGPYFIVAKTHNDTRIQKVLFMK
ncbi:MAG: hypothetical protein HOD28_04540 [Candidatus Marinimicrobia bacterium]|nr:hypothetical protein [Candidatus Neomarinimicrobiota bacterium]MBT3960670.1 hypothetical protein [Candidatus Neomarinimicrobiota bacterium]MBT4382860.1 hypothetical protein [Candidatus Neomarinimicrobiota bacterium]MBT4635060.1 hypothetical protein [Candidatus Neomarinimicrobiota bacterium]MBT4686359.1 hypothetical protein [Candidatus Neomarinimicrobiota bacterium]